MFTTKIQSIDGYDEINVYNVSDFDLLEFNTKKIKAKKFDVYDDFMTFDIETSTIIKNDVPTGFMYIWQCCINNQIIIGRTWEEFFEFINKLVDKLNINPKQKLICYVHNLAYEFQFLLSFQDELGGFDEVFAIAKRKPLKVSCGNGLEFRCSMRLSNMSLAKFTKTELGVKHPKCKGDLDYKTVRTKSTELTETELGYCINDVLGLYEAVKMRMQHTNHDTKTIPLTSTGFVRSDCRSECNNTPYYRLLFSRNAMNENIYTLLREEFRGGNTHANRIYSGITQYSKQGESYDITSSYPFQCIRGRYPGYKFFKYGMVTDLTELLELGLERPLLYRVCFEGLRVKLNIPFPYISVSKALYVKYDPNYLEDNGRVLKASSIILTVNEIDMRIILRHYDFTKVYTSMVYASSYIDFPEPLKKKTLYYYKLKTELKDKINKLEEVEQTSEVIKELEELNYLYAQAKAKLNAIYGMCATNPVKGELIINADNEWILKELDIQTELDKYNKNYNSFLVYAWGCWVTAYGREQLDAFYSMKGIDPIYCDTDSCKCRVTEEGYKNIDWMNKKIEKIAEKSGAYVDVNGKRYYLGLWDRETKNNPWTEFKTLGAKKYCYVDKNGLHVTISGVNKKLGVKELKTIDNFNPGFVFKESGGQTLYYNSDPIEYITVNGDTFLTGSNVGMIDSTYKLNLTEDYEELLELYSWGNV